MDVETDSSEGRFAEAEKVLGEWLERDVDGSTLDIDALVGRHPELAKELRELAGQVNELEGVLEGDEGGGADDRARIAAMLKPLSDAPHFSQRYEVGPEIGRGGMGAIREVMDRRLGRPLAMKMILDQARSTPGSKSPPVSARRVARFLNEALITGQLEHPGIVPVHEVGIDEEGRVYFTMKLVKGLTLTEAFRRLRTRDPAWSTARVLGVLQRICDAVAFAHDRRVVHRDLKPANIMIGEFGEIYVMDWGLSRRIDEPPETKPVAREVDEQLAGMTLEGHVVGTPAYMSPEQARGSFDQMGPWSDVYSIGAMLYQLIAGHPPYLDSASDRISGNAVLNLIAKGPPMPLRARKASVELIAICEKAMAYDRARRYANVSDLADDLRRFLERRVVRAYDVGTWAETKKWIARNRLLAGSALMVVFVLVVGGMVSTHYWFEARVLSFTADATARELQITKSRENVEVSESQFQRYAGAIRAAKMALDDGEIENVHRHLAAAPESLRSWEWRNLASRVDMSCIKFGGHGGPVTVARFSPDETKVLTGSVDGTVRVWDAETGETIFIFPDNGGAVNDVATSPDGTQILVCSEDKDARVYDGEDGSLLFRLIGHVGPVKSGTFSPDGATIATGSADATARLWRSDAGSLIVPLRGHDKPIESVTFSPDGAEVLTTSDDGTARQWQANSGELIRTLPGHSNWIRRGEYSRDGESIVTASDDSTARVWSRKDGTVVSRLTGHTDYVRMAEFSPDGRRVVTASDDTTARVWDARSGKELFKFTLHDYAVLSARFSNDGKRVVSTARDKSVRVWDSTTGDTIAKYTGHESEVGSAVFSRDDARILSASSDHTARIWSAGDEEDPVGLRGHSDRVMSVAFSSDGALIVSASDDATARLWDALRRSELLVLRGHIAGVHAAKFSPDSSRIVTASADATIRLWTTYTGELDRTLTGHTKTVQSAEFSPDGRRIVSASDDGTVRIWDADTGDERVRIDTHGGKVWSACFDPSGSRVVTAHDDGTVGLWEAGSGAPIRTFRKHSHAVNFACFHENGSHILSASDDRTVRLFDAGTGDDVSVFEGHDDAVYCAAWSPDSRRLLTGSNDETVRIWDTGRAKELASLSTPTRVLSIAMSPDGSQVAAGSRNYSVWFWSDAPLREWHRKVKESIAAETEADRVLDTAAKYGDFRAIASSLCVDTSLSPTLRSFALLQLMRRVKRVQVWLERLRADEGDRDSVLAAIRQDVRFDDASKLQALRVAAGWKDDAAALNTFAWDRAWRPAQPRAEYEKALRAARLAVRNDLPTDASAASHMNTLCAALYRNDRFEEALATLQDARARRHGTDTPSDLVFLAMIEWRLGDKDAAVAALDLFHKAMKDSNVRDEAAHQSLLHEVDALFEAPTSTGPPAGR